MELYSPEKDNIMEGDAGNFWFSNSILEKKTLEIPQKIYKKQPSKPKSSILEPNPSNPNKIQNSRTTLP
jgi:hypothetical protein